jgi:hypothetical protein
MITVGLGFVFDMVACGMLDSEDMGRICSLESEGEKKRVCTDED